MEAAEYENIALLEAEHWYYAGKREIVRHWLDRCGPVRNDHVLLDCGAGTGAFAAEMDARCQVLVLDDHEESLRHLRRRFRAEQVLSLSGDAVPLPDGSMDFVTALDVLEHVLDDRAVVNGFARLLRPGGVAVVTVPASMALWSDWDVSLHHFRRYARSGLAALFSSSQWEIIELNYTNALAFPFVWALRRSRRRAATGVRPERSEDRVPPRAINSLLKRLFVTPAILPVRCPFGVSLLLVARRRGNG